MRTTKRAFSRPYIKEDPKRLKRAREEYERREQRARERLVKALTALPARVVAYCAGLIEDSKPEAGPRTEKHENDARGLSSATSNQIAAIIAADPYELSDRITEALPMTLPSMQPHLTSLLRTLEGDDEGEDVKPVIQLETDEDVKPDIRAADVNADVKPDVKPDIKPDVEPPRKKPKREAECVQVDSRGSYIRSVDTTPLRLLVQGVDPTALRDRILDALPTISPSDFAGLSAVLEPLRTGVSSVRHCLRCHSEYDESVNHGRACVIPHAAVIEPGGHGDEECRAACCGARWFAGDDGAHDCYRGRHTNAPRDVEYSQVDDEALAEYEERMDAAVDDDADDDSGGDELGMIVRTCAQAGCAK